MTMTRMTDLGAYNVAKSDSGKFIVLLNGNKASFLPFDKYSDCLHKVVALNAGYSDKVLPKYKKLFKTNSRGKTCAAPPHRTLSG